MLVLRVRCFKLWCLKGANLALLLALDKSRRESFTGFSSLNCWRAAAHSCCIRKNSLRYLPWKHHTALSTAARGRGGGGRRGDARGEKGAKKGRGTDAGNAPLNDRNFLGGGSAGTVVGGVQHGVLHRDFCLCLVQLLLQLLQARLEIVDLLLLLEQQALFLGGKDGDLDGNVRGMRLKRLNGEEDLGR